MFYTLNLASLCNHKLIYTKMPQEERNKENYGLDNICILRTDLKMKKNEVLDGVDFILDFSEEIICISRRSNN